MGVGTPTGNGALNSGMTEIVTHGFLQRNNLFLRFFFLWKEVTRVQDNFRYSFTVRSQPFKS